MTKSKIFKTDFRERVTLNQVHQLWSRYALFIKHGAIGQNKK